MRGQRIATAHDPWQPELRARLAERVPGDVVPDGSVTAPELLDGWSDLDVAVTAREPFELEDVLGAPSWTVQEAADGDTQVLRAVLVDGRRADLGILREVLEQSMLAAALRRGAASGSRR